MSSRAIGEDIAAVAAFARVDRTAALPLVPYPLWVRHATVLNYALWRLNR